METKTISIKNLYKLDWKTLIKTKTFWIGVIMFIAGFINGNTELVLTGAGIVSLRDAISK